VRGPVASRFEAYWRGIELANGFHELADASEQRRRFELDLTVCRDKGLRTPPIDEHFLAALEHGLPECAGVALGFDRLVMCVVGATHIEEVIAFPFGSA
jgi:lysyl-tRNA synthetase class 2